MWAKRASLPDPTGEGVSGRDKGRGGDKEFAVYIECCYSMHKRERHSNADKGSSQMLVANTIKSLRPVQEKNIQGCGMTLKQFYHPADDEERCTCGAARSKAVLKVADARIQVESQPALEQSSINFVYRIRQTDRPM